MLQNILLQSKLNNFYEISNVYLHYNLGFVSIKQIVKKAVK